MTVHTPISTDYDETHWPLAIVVSETPLGSEQLQLGLRTVEEWVKRRQPFALLLISVAAPIFQSYRDARHMLDDWFDTNLQSLHHTLLGVAVVTPDMPELRASVRPARFSSHIPLEVFRNGMDAAAWRQASILAPAGLTINSL